MHDAGAGQPAEKPTSFLATIRRSLNGKHYDYTQGSIPQAVILLAIPMILELGLESVFAVVDMFFVGKLGSNAIATVGLTEAVISIVYSIAMGISVGATAVVARRIGEKNPEGAAHAGAQAIVLAVACSVILGILGAIYAPEILHLMGASPAVVTEGASFTRILLGGNTVILLLFLNNGIFRGAGDAAMAMKSLWLASGANIILCPILIHFYGLKGAAIATVVGRLAGVLYQAWHLFKGDGALRFRASHFGFDLPVLRTISQIAWPASLQFIIGSGSYILLTRLVAETGGTDASAGYQIAFRNFMFFMLPAWGLSNAAATLVGQNLGAKQFDRAVESVYVTAKFSNIFMAVVTVFFFVLAHPIVSIFTDSPAILEYGTFSLKLIGSGYIFYGIGMVMSQALNGAGDTKTPTWLNIICFWAFQTPLAYFCAYTLKMGATGAILAIPGAHALFAFVSWWVFRKGKWKDIKV